MSDNNQLPEAIRAKLDEMQKEEGTSISVAAEDLDYNPKEETNETQEAEPVENTEPTGEETTEETTEEETTDEDKSDDDSTDDDDGEEAGEEEEENAEEDGLDEQEETSETTEPSGNNNPGPKQRAKIKLAEAEKRIAELTKELDDKTTELSSSEQLLHAEYNQRLELQKQYQQDKKTNAYLDANLEYATQYRDVLNKQLRANTGKYLGVDGNEVSRDEAEKLLVDTDEYIASVQESQKQEDVNIYNKPGLPLQSAYADQTPSQYTRRVRLSKRFKEVDRDPGLIEVMSPRYVDAIDSLDKRTQLYVLAGLGEMLDFTNTSEGRSSVEKLGSDWDASENDFTLRSKIELFGKEYEQEINKRSESKKTKAAVKKNVKPGGKPGKGTATSSATGKYSGPMRNKDLGETKQEFFDRMRKEGVMM